MSLRDALGDIHRAIQYRHGKYLVRNVTKQRQHGARHLRCRFCKNATTAYVGLLRESLRIGRPLRDDMFEM